METQKIFYQSSLPRSGSTLLQNIIGQNPDFYVTPTSGVLELLYAARHNYTNSPEFKAQDPEVMENGFRGFCKSGIEGFYKNITDKPYIIDKSRGWGYYQNFIKFFQPEPKIICMVRDPRAIISSMEKIHRQSTHTSSPVVNDNNMQGITTEQRIDIWVQSQPVGLAFERLKQIIKEGNDKDMLFVRYEDLTAYPAQQLKRIYDYLEVPNYNHDFNNVQQITKEDDEVYGMYGDHTIRNKVEVQSNDFNQVLGRDAAQWVANFYGWFYDYFKYTV